MVRRAGEGSASSGAAGRRFTVSGPRTAGPSGRQHGQWRVSTEYIPRWSVFLLAALSPDVRHLPLFSGLSRDSVQLHPF